MLKETNIGSSPRAITLSERDRGLVIEFVGPPGSGKTTNCLVFHDLLTTMKLKVFVFNDVKEYFHHLSFTRKSRLYLKTLWVAGRDIFAYTFALLSNGVRSWNSIYRYLKLCVFNMALKEFKREKKVDIILLDQWSIQGLWSATILKPAKFDRLADQLHKFYLKTDMVIYFDINAETACERIDSRTWGKSRFDKMNRTQRLVELKKNSSYLRDLFDRSSCAIKLKYSTLVSPRRNAETFIKQMNELQMT